MIVRFRSKEITFRLIPILLMLYSALIPLENVLVASFGGSINKYIGLSCSGSKLTAYSSSLSTDIRAGLLHNSESITEP